jgi:orotidine-5'-phosphate decarboxylase
LYHAVGDKLSALALQHMGKYGYGAFGAVVGADPKTGAEREEAAALRERYSSLFFLIPGYGAQGGAAEDAALLLREGNGGVVNASRSILKAWMAKDTGTGNGETPADVAAVDNGYAAEAAREAVAAMRDAIRQAVKK